MKENYKLVDSVLKNDKQMLLVENVSVCTDKESEKLLGYNFTINSNYDTEKKYSVQILSNHIKSEDIHYTIDNSEIMRLNSDNMILRKNINANDSHNYLFKVWLANDYQENDLNILIKFE